MISTCCCGRARGRPLSHRGRPRRRAWPRARRGAAARADRSSRSPRVVAEHEVLEHGQRRDQRRVLVDRADAELERLPRRGDRRLDAVDPDRARHRADQPGEDADQGRLAGAVLAEQAVHLARRERQADVVVREHARERLGDPDQLDDRRSVVVPCVHRARPDFLQRNVLEGAPRTRGGPRAAAGARRLRSLLDQLLDGPRVVRDRNLDLPGLDARLRRLDLRPGAPPGCTSTCSSEMPPFLRLRL